MNIRMFSLIGAVLLLLGGCDSGADKSTTVPADGDTTATATTDTTEISTPYHAEHLQDLTGDGTPERITLTAIGDSYDSLDVQLRIYSPENSLLYATDWNTQLYFVYTPAEGQSDSAIQKTVLDHLNDVLVDKAFSTSHMPGRNGSMQDITRDVIDYDVREQIWRTAHNLPDTAALPPQAMDEVNKTPAPADRVDALVAELDGHPTFTFFSGGEFTRTIAWSQKEHRFVTIYACC